MKTLAPRKINVIVLITVVSILTGCADTTEQAVETPVVDVTPETDTIDDVITEPEVVETKVYVGKDNQPPLRPKPIDANEVVVAPELVINVDNIINHITDNNIEKIDETIGKPVFINTNADNTFNLRYYQIDDDNVVEIIDNGEAVKYFTIYYRQGYPTSLEAVEAAGFKEEQLTLRIQAPQEVVNAGVRLAQDRYSADTPNYQYRHIAAFSNKKGLWYIVVFDFVNR